MAKYILMRLGSELSHRPLVGGVYVDLNFFFFKFFEGHYGIWQQMSLKYLYLITQ